MGVAPRVIVFPIGGAHLEVKRAAVCPLGFEVSLPFTREGVLGARMGGEGGGNQDCGREEGCQSAMHHKLTSEGDPRGTPVRFPCMETMERGKCSTQILAEGYILDISTIENFPGCAAATAEAICGSMGRINFHLFLLRTMIASF